MEPNRRFSILTFPQFFDGNALTLRIVVLPRNQNPLQPAIEQNDPPIPDAPAFADANLAFVAKVITGLQSFPNNHLATDTVPLAAAPPPDARSLFEALANNFSISNLGQANEDLAANQDKAGAAVPQQLSVFKYLPQTYRKAFNFTSPRTRNAKTDDSYHCAIRDAKKVPGFKRSPDAISWGKVFAYALRQPLLATRLGMIYETTLTIDAAHFPQGGWLYIDLADGSDFKAQQLADDSFVKKYAARIPALQAGTPRQVFAPILFPVLYKANAADPDPAPDGNYDAVFIEAAEYDDGFAKVVHCFQPRSRNLLVEENEEAHPVKDLGIRLGWDDEQILIWYMRQMMEDPSVANPDKRLDAPLGVFGYSIDVREVENPESLWESLNAVESKQELFIPADPGNPDAGILALGDFAGELPFQVYPVQLDGNTAGSYWLPMYFANWNGHSMVLPDQDAAEVYQTGNPGVQADPETPAANPETGTGVSGPAQNNLNKMYNAAPLATSLRYGNQYEFRARLRDLSGGAPGPGTEPANESPSGVGRCRFKRYLAPNQPRIEELQVNTDEVPNLAQLNIRRPLLGYPAVVYTGKYTDPIGRLITASQQMQGKEAFGIADPDVDRVEVIVEVQALKMDKLLSISGKEDYVHLYTTYRSFPALADEDGYDDVLNIPITYADCKVLHAGPETDLAADLQLPDDIDNLVEIVLPTARTVRLTVRAVCEEKADNEEYYGALDPGRPERDNRYGHILQMMTYQASSDETDLFVDASPAHRLQGIFLQPDEATAFDGKLATLLLGKEVVKAPDAVQRLARQLDLEHIGLTLTAPKGERVQFGCSNRIRHSLSPDNSSLTFASRGDLSGHWLCCLNLALDRDWAWDALEGQSLVITRTMRFTHDDAETETVVSEAGDIEIRRTASFESLHNPKRNYTRLLFIDAVEPKNSRMQPAPNETEPRFPDTIEVSYAVEVRFKAGHAAAQDENLELGISLPVTTAPSQVPKIVSAGIALSPYTRNEKYSATEPRRRYLWVEFEEAIKDPNDTYFARVLAYAPDQLISNNHPELFAAPQEPALPIDPEQIRVIPPGATNDLAGLNAMQPMEKAQDSDRHYLLPLPPGLHAGADEMFGFFTYEFRVGHFRHRESQEMAWCTAQGRFGRRLRATGIQHPAPALTCSANRDEEKLYVSAPYAVAVHDGKNVTADPPRTQLWCLLYAQVKQADNKDFRNILLDDKQLDWRVQVEEERQVNWFARYDSQQRQTLKNITVRNFKDDLSYANFQHVYKLADSSTTNKDATKYGTVVWSNKEVTQLLQLYGLPEGAPLSVLVVEFLPFITNIYEHISGLGQQEVAARTRNFVRNEGLPAEEELRARAAQFSEQQDFQQVLSPLSDRLGHHRILRTSPLTEVPFVCCVDCG